MLRAPALPDLPAIGPSVGRFLLLIGLAVTAIGTAPARAADVVRPPNVVLIMADDLGIGDLGCYGQKRIRTPNIDALARSGMRFTQFYSGNAVCAPTRCSLMTGKHPGHAYIRNNREVKSVSDQSRGAGEGQEPIPHDAYTMAEFFQARGYATGCFGKWGLGGPGSTGEPNGQGFDRFYGYLCQGVAHNLYPDHLWSDRSYVPLKNRSFSSKAKLAAVPEDPNFHRRYMGTEYGPDLIFDEALKFLDANKEQPFFLYYPTVIPHLALQVPEDSLVEYDGAFEDAPYLGDDGYLPHSRPRAAYAAMITRMDAKVGKLVERIRELGLEEETLILFTSDNGPTYLRGPDTDFFESALGFRGKKGSLYEGGIRAPMIASWKGVIEEGVATDQVGAHWDLFATFCDLQRVARPADQDGVSLLPTLTGQGEQERHDALYWELGPQQAIRVGDWKLYRRYDKQGRLVEEGLFDLAADPGETNDLAPAQPAKLAELRAAMEKEHVPSVVFPAVWDARAK
ncbi:MAG TPA: arylsulfatase [Pirellulaceae bacterium]|jgi:arylsulfatase|nr:arylsulfatase [Pirellulaceae bacterium]